MPEELKKLTVEVSNECWKKIKILSIHREVTLAEQVREILEKAVVAKKFEVGVPEVQ